MSNNDSIQDQTNGSSMADWNRTHHCVKDITDANARFTESNRMSAFISFRLSDPHGCIAAILESKFSSSIWYGIDPSVSRYLFTTHICTSSCGISFHFLS